MDNYNKSQDGVNVEVISMPNETYDDKLKVMLSAGSDADIVNVRSLDQVMQFKEAGAMKDITDMVKEQRLGYQQVRFHVGYLLSGWCNYRASHAIQLLDAVL